MSTLCWVEVFVINFGGNFSLSFFAFTRLILSGLHFC